MTDRTNGDVLAKSLVTGREITCTSVMHERTYKSEAVNKYEKLTGNSTRECGLFVSPVHPFLCASPDRLVNESLLVEVKCPYAAKKQNNFKCNCTIWAGGAY